MPRNFALLLSSCSACCNRFNIAKHSRGNATGAFCRQLQPGAELVARSETPAISASRVRMQELRCKHHQIRVLLLPLERPRATRGRGPAADWPGFRSVYLASARPPRAQPRLKPHLMLHVPALGQPLTIEPGQSPDFHLAGDRLPWIPAPLLSPIPPLVGQKTRAPLCCICPGPRFLFASCPLPPPASRPSFLVPLNSS